mmetsp:Transcript_2156/g.6821  ORF Transcript_2156/g.6821 Transcript_2156/m.6821 type:complete len:204 (-) Transcript_2156:466-1077(-)
MRELSSSMCFRSSVWCAEVHWTSCARCSLKSLLRLFRPAQRSWPSSAKLFSSASARSAAVACCSASFSRPTLVAAASCPSRGSSVRSSMMASSTRPVKLASDCCCNCTSSRSTFCPSIRSRISLIIISRACSISDLTYSRRSLPKTLSSSLRASTSSARLLSKTSTLARPLAAVTSILSFRATFSCRSLGSSSSASLRRCLSR